MGQLREPTPRPDRLRPESGRRTPSRPSPGRTPDPRPLAQAAAPFKTRAAYDWAVETSIYVQKDFHGHGVGKRLYLALEDLLRQQNILNSNACITYPNPESIHFHEALGYRMVAHFSKCGYKLGRWHDMVWMEKHLAQHPEHPEPVISVNNCLPISGL